MEVVAGNDEMVNGTSGEVELQEWIAAQIEQVQAWDAEITLRPERCPELAGPMLSAALRIEQAQRTLAEFRARKMAQVRSAEQEWEGRLPRRPHTNKPPRRRARGDNENTCHREH